VTDFRAPQSAPPADARPVAAATGGSVVQARGVTLALGIAIAVTAWMPWISSPRTVFGSASVDAWGLPASILWSSTPAPGGLELGYLILLTAALCIAAAFVVSPAGLGRAAGALGIVVALLFAFQLWRSIHDSPFSGTASVFDYLGAGVYVLGGLGVAAALFGGSPRRH
jgi:hypothetical protein